ncbi:MAG: hypothetical protein GC172_03785 [Phycisphaera sp.]|nr:hypothetical protein [Phycisphaera sp.]
MTGFGGPGGGFGGPRGGFGGFRVFTVGRDAASRFRVRLPWRLRPNAGPLERILVGVVTFIVAIPVAVVILALAVVALVAALGCAAVLVAFALVGFVLAWLVRTILGVGPRATMRVERARDDGRENVRVIPPRDGV